MKTRTILAAGLLGLFIATTVHAQAIVPDGFGGFYDPMDEPPPSGYHEDRAFFNEFMEGSSLRGPSEYEREMHDRIRAREGCDVFTNNAQARFLCLQGLR